MRVIGLTFEDAPTFVCPVCNKAYKSERGLQDHMKKEHPDYTGGSDKESE